MTDLDNLQAWLAIEHEAVWLYGVIGGRLDDLSDAAREAWNRHRDTRDLLESSIKAAGGEPVGPQLGYAPADIDDKDAARAAAQAIENQVTTAAVGTLDDPARRADSITSLRAAAAAATEWGAKLSAFPGLD